MQTKDHLIEKLSPSMQEACHIDNTLFAKFGVKRGLRNDDGSGVVAGISRVGDTVGYERLKDGSLKPIPGMLFYRGIDVEDIAHGLMRDKRFGFEETTFLLLTGKLPTKEELREFQKRITKEMALSLKTKMSIINLEGLNIMNILARTVLVMYTMDKKADDLSPDNLLRQSIGIISKFPTIIAYAYNTYRHTTRSQPLHIRIPKSNLSLAENFLYMLKRDYTPLEARLLDLLLVLHAEHGGGNNSTFTVRVVSSAATDTYSAIAAGISSLKGPLHGGANLQVSDMIHHMRDNIKNKEDIGEIDAYFERMLKKEVYNKTGLIYGIGHAVYTISDPRANLLKELARDLAKEKNVVKDFEFIERLEERGIKSFTKFKGKGSKTVSSNVDMYSGFVYEMIGLPQELYTPLFAMARVAGWCAHRNEELLFQAKRIIRPAYKNISTKKPYVPIAKRK